MKSKLASAVIGACILGASGFVSLANAQPRMMRSEARDPMPRLERMAACLDLTDEQIKKIQDSWTSRLSERAELRREIMRIRNELRGEMLKDDPDFERVKKLAAKRGEIQTKMQVSRLESQLALREILTPEQRDRLTMLRAGGRGGFRGDDMGGRRGRIGRGRGWRDGRCLDPRTGPRPRRSRMW